ncbi:hypothetical protein L211DRAFT_866122 [Terfezia boudieri ATCC MYA-4762]|uniref:HTH CENPB-type domain-containing protein n=1 Tax=Terfezia boudieri ATCC MYA-4762 TaxID=1051890 RepID=A0A3N4M092_9PEZI|nr:hypothetical protein L211DRAFT_866122 [Terfezia boudieri ATCC MYA-4762]
MKRAFSLREKYEIRLERRTQLEAGKMLKLELLFPGRDGKGISTSTLSDILSNSKEILMHPPIDGSHKKKSRAPFYPMFEAFLAEWIERAHCMRVPVNDAIIQTQAQLIIQELSSLEFPLSEEDYTDFSFSHGWLSCTFSAYQYHSSLSSTQYNRIFATLDADIHLIAQSWNLIRAATIFHCWQRVGIVASMDLCMLTLETEDAIDQVTVLDPGVAESAEAWLKFNEDAVIYNRNLDVLPVSTIIQDGIPESMQQPIADSEATSAILPVNEAIPPGVPTVS